MITLLYVVHVLCRQEYMLREARVKPASHLGGFCLRIPRHGMSMMQWVNPLLLFILMVALWHMAHAPILDGNWKEIDVPHQ